MCSKYHLYYTVNITYKKSVLFISASSDANPVCLLHVDLDSDNYGNIKLLLNGRKFSRAWMTRKKVKRKQNMRTHWKR